MQNPRRCQPDSVGNPFPNAASDTNQSGIPGDSHRHNNPVADIHADTRSDSHYHRNARPNPPHAADFNAASAQSDV